MHVLHTFGLAVSVTVTTDTEVGLAQVEMAILAWLIELQHAFVDFAGSLLHEAAAGAHEGNSGASAAFLPGSAKAEAVRASTAMIDLIILNE
jgi:hypothetical protein